MISKFEVDLKVEKEVVKFVDKYSCARINHDFERTLDRTRQH
ncbi:hypothetical protein SAMN04488081_1236 [Salimicrobium album]|uniref:Transposase n=1 Tax=Salimicrobium album TaxID=50717 RepID=A0A1H3E3W1_9BACI|nr:hypothetical protein SAMN04488081_1236 [Salimicrobium album]